MFEFQIRSDLLKGGDSFPLVTDSGDTVAVVSKIILLEIYLYIQNSEHGKLPITGNP